MSPFPMTTPLIFLTLCVNNTIGLHSKDSLTVQKAETLTACVNGPLVKKDCFSSIQFLLDFLFTSLSKYRDMMFLLFCRKSVAIHSSINILDLRCVC